jgi:hypothetical protein
MDINLTINAPQICDSLNKFSAALSQLGLVNTAQSAPMQWGQAQPLKESKVANATPAAPAAPAPLATVEPAASVTMADNANSTTSASQAVALTVDQVKTLAALKAKKVGSATVKAIIADTGAATIGEIKEALVLASLAANLEAL